MTWLRLIAKGGASLPQYALRIVCIGVWAASTQAAGVVEFSQGLVQAEAPLRALRAGDRVDAGQTVSTAPGAEIHLRLDDGTLLALRAQSRLSIEIFRAQSDSRTDQIRLRLIQGAVRILPGYVARLGDRKSELLVNNAVLRLADGDIDAQIINEGTAPGAYFRARAGAAVVSNEAGERVLNNTEAVRVTALGVPNTAAQTPFADGNHDNRIEQQKTGHVERVLKQLHQARTQLAKSGGANENGAPRIPDCANAEPIRQALDTFVQAYQNNQIFELQNRLDAALVGRQRLLDAMREDQLRLRQIDLRWRDTQIQCGPNVAVLQTTWEKRFLDAQTFQPGKREGRTSLLFHWQGDAWKLAALSGDNPFGAGASGALASISFSSRITIGTNTPVFLLLNDPDLVSQAVARVELSTNLGDRLSLNLNNIGPGQFRVQLPLATGAANPANATLEINTGAVITARYADANPGGGRPATVVSSTAAVAGAADTTPDAFNFAAVAFGCNNNPGTYVASAAVVMSGINAPSAVSITDLAGPAPGPASQYRINGGAWTSAVGQITNGQTLEVRAQAPAVLNGLIPRSSVTVGGVSANFSINCN